MTFDRSGRSDVMDSLPHQESQRATERKGGTSGKATTHEELTGLDELFSRVEKYRGGKEYLEFLRFVAGFHRYSIFNAALAHVQRPGARFVLTASRWMDEYGRRPKVGAQPIVLLRPMGPVMFAYDLCETEGPELPPERTSFMSLQGRLHDDGVVWETIAAAREMGVEIEFVPMGSSMGGFAFDPAPVGHGMNIEIRREAEEDSESNGSREERRHEVTYPWAAIRINKNYDRPEETYRILTHELGHLYCGHIGEIPVRGKWEARGGLDMEVMEFEAESVSFLVCRRIGLDLRSEVYLRRFFDEHGTIPGISVQRVLKAAKFILDMGKPYTRTEREDALPLRRPKEPRRCPEAASRDPEWGML